MNRHRTAVWKLAVVLCVITLLACQLGPQRSQGPSASPTPEPVSASPVVPSPATLVPPSAEPAALPLPFAIGKNDFVTTVDDTPRRFIVYVPSGYDPGRPTPVVMMFHGSNQTGNMMYENTNWVARAEQENFIVVFPTSWRYFLTSSNKVEAKWYDLVMEVTEPTVEFKDDVHFIRVILDRLNATFNVDDQRVFATGMSNGAYFVVTRLLVQMSDAFAAFATAGMGPSGPGEVDRGGTTTRVNTSLYKMFGTQDALIAERMGLPLPFPFEAEDIVNDPNFLPMLVVTTAGLDLDMSYTLESGPGYNTLTFDQSLVGADNEFVFQMVRGMPHVYPDGNNNAARLDATVLFWEFFMRHVKP